MRIAILINTLYSGGAEKQSVYLAKILSERFSVVLIVLQGNKTEKKFMDLIEIEKINIIKLKGGILKNAIDVFKIIKKQGINTIFSYLARGNLINGVVGSLCGVPNRIGGIRNAELSPYKLPFERLFHNQFLTKTISNSYSAVETLTKSGFKRKKFQVIHNTFDLKNPLLIRDNKQTINIISVARFVPQKDYYTAIQSIVVLKQNIKNKNLKFTYTIIGYGALEQKIRQWITKFDLSNEVNVVINPPNISEYLKEADLYLSTSLFEGLSNSIMEAMAFSLPVVATNVGDNQYLVLENKTGFLISGKDSKALANRLAQLIESNNLRIEMSKNAYQHLKENFSEMLFTKKYLNLIQKLSDE